MIRFMQGLFKVSLPIRWELDLPPQDVLSRPSELIRRRRRRRRRRFIGRGGGGSRVAVERVLRRHRRHERAAVLAAAAASSAPERGWRGRGRVTGRGSSRLVDWLIFKVKSRLIDQKC